MLCIGIGHLSMSDRRRAPRYVLESPLAGEAMPMQDVVVERFSENRLVVISPSSHTQDEELMIHIVMPNGLASHRANVITSQPISVAGTLCFRLELHLDAAEPFSHDERNP
ncbi:MAG: hypothetical protein AUH43_27500 [Acidobacteria bacterium 13_1_40CM_65_14]|nr:MAG: hypothetical protein AUH43_27500 [Acidobacteria bacterium 13_1_40CM_65_14]